jgi:hypothetical protein
MEDVLEQSETLDLISQETGKDLKNSEKLLEFWGKKAEVNRRQPSRTIMGTRTMFMSGVTFASGSFF